MSDVLALIPARGGSKGIPRKNVMSFAGKPLIAYSIIQALKSKHIKRVIVSTDDPEISEAARAWGAEVPFMRPTEHAQDLSPDIDVFRHALLWLKDNESYEPDMIVHLRPTSPIRQIKRIDKAIELLIKHAEADALRSVNPAMQSPYKMWKITSSGYLCPLLKLDGVSDCHSLPRQELPMVYWQNGYIDVIRTRTILDKNSMTGECVIPFIHDESIVDLDYPEDIPVMEESLKRLVNGLSLEGQKSPKRHPV